MDNLNKGRKKDDVYKYYVKDNINNKINCIVENCEKIFSINTSTTILKNHFHKNHEKYLNKNLDNNNITEMKHNLNKKNKHFYCLF